MWMTLSSFLSSKKTFLTRIQTRESNCYDRKRKKKRVVKHSPLTQPTSYCFILMFAKTEQISPLPSVPQNPSIDVNFNFWQKGVSWSLRMGNNFLILVSAEHTYKCAFYNSISSKPKLLEKTRYWIIASSHMLSPSCSLFASNWPYL